MPALILTPIVYLKREVTQQQISIIIGAINAVLVFLLLKKFTTSTNALFLTVFFALGTVAFWSSVVGTVWYFAHNTALMFFLLSLMAFKNKKDFLSGLFLTFASLCRLPIFLGIVFYVFELRKQKGRLIKFLTGAFLCIPIVFLYNWLRFGGILHTGYIEVYKTYLGMDYPLTFFQSIYLNFPNFGYFDIRNIPLHFLTFLFMPPLIKEGVFIPSPYGMGIIFTTPLLFIALIPPLKRGLEKNLFRGFIAIAFVDFLHYMQGWVQFGYRFLLDFLPFLLIILAIRFKPRKIYILLLAVSVAVNFWGVNWAIKLGW